MIVNVSVVRVSELGSIAVCPPSSDTSVITGTEVTG